MSLVVIALAAAAAGVATSAFAVRWWKRGRLAAEPKVAGQASMAASMPPGRAWTLPLSVGDVVQVQDETCWLCSAAMLREDGELRGALLFGQEPDAGRVLLVFAVPAGSIGWMERATLDLPARPPSRIEIEGRLLERQESFCAAVDYQRHPPLGLGASATVALYRGGVGDMAVALSAKGESVLYAGRWLDEGDYDRLGNVDPDAHDDLDAVKRAPPHAPDAAP